MRCGLAHEFFLWTAHPLKTEAEELRDSYELAQAGVHGTLEEVRERTLQLLERSLSR
jgi:hypothetical protein